MARGWVGGVQYGEPPAGRHGPSRMLKLSPDEAAVLKAVCADRDTDLPRLVYADWLDDHDRPERAEFIRLQVTATRQPSDHTGYQIEPRIGELLAAHRDRWLRELPKWAVVTGPHAFVRGFVEVFDMPAGPFTLTAPQLLDRTPVRRLILRSLRKVAPNLTRCGWLGEVPSLWLLNERLGDDAVTDLMTAPWLVNSRELNLVGNDLTDRAARALANCPYLRGLVRLDLGRNQLGRTGVEWLLASPHLTACRFSFWANERLNADRHAVERLLGPRGTL